MTIDKSLKIKRGANTNRSVLTRVERVTKLVDEGKWSEDSSPLGMPKVRVRKLQLKKKKKAAKDEDTEKSEE